MTSNSQKGLDFAPEHDQPVPYMQRTRDWYVALGYGNPYVWAHYIDTPFQPLKKSLREVLVAIITTAAPYQSDKGPQGPGAPYNASAKFYQVYSRDSALDHDLRNAHVGIDRMHTSMKDSASWFPQDALRRAAAAGRIGNIAPRLHGVPTNRSQRHTLDVDCPDVLARCLEDGVDAAILLPNCPVCHQTLSLVARHLEQNGISTVLMGCAKDIVEYCGVPRLLFSDFPLGNAAGRPHDLKSQRETLDLALTLLETASGARTTMQNPQRWSDDPDWKLDYSNVERVSEDEINRLRTENDLSKEKARNIRKTIL
ncbi:MAG: glycine reductase [Gammaproteobacteria bacterium]|nr:MAG: glycine reductase [Gammaproteobacteria bacterium]